MSDAGIAFETSISSLDGRDTLRVIGEIDIATAPAFLEAMERAIDGRTNLELDLRDTTFMDSSGVAALVAVHRRLGQRRGAIVVRGPAAAVRQVLAITGVDALFDLR